MVIGGRMAAFCEKSGRSTQSGLAAFTMSWSCDVPMPFSPKWNLGPANLKERRFKRAQFTKEQITGNLTKH